MKSFLQFLTEDVVPFYHKTHPDIAKRLQSGEPIYQSGLSVFLDPDMASNYTAQTSGGHIPGDAVTVTGKVSTSRVVPDLEWHPEAYNELLGKVNPDRPPTLHVNRVTGGGQPYRITIPGIRAGVDPQTGSKKLVPNWGVTKDASGKPVLQVGTSITDMPSGRMIDRNRGAVPFGGAATTGGKLGYPETPWLDVLGRKSDVTKLTRDFMKTGSPNETGFKAFRTMGASGVKVDVPPKPPATPKSSRLPGVLGAGLAALGLASGAKAEDIATGFLDPISTPFDRAAGLGSDQLDTDIDKYYDKQGRPKRSAWPADATDVQGKPITNWSPEK